MEASNRDETVLEADRGEGSGGSEKGPEAGCCHLLHRAVALLRQQQQDAVLSWPNELTRASSRGWR